MLGCWNVEGQNVKFYSQERKQKRTCTALFLRPVSLLNFNIPTPQHPNTPTPQHSVSQHLLQLLFQHPFNFRQGLVQSIKRFDDVIFFLKHICPEC